MTSSRNPRSFTHGQAFALPSLPKVGAVCLNWARTDLCGGRRVTCVPTAIHGGGSTARDPQPTSPISRIAVQQVCFVAGVRHLLLWHPRRSEGAREAAGVHRAGCCGGCVAARNAGAASGGACCRVPQHHFGCNGDLFCWVPRWPEGRRIC